jgi:hypothetical protein
MLACHPRARRLQAEPLTFVVAALRRDNAGAAAQFGISEDAHLFAAQFSHGRDADAFHPLAGNYPGRALPTRSCQNRISLHPTCGANGLLARQSPPASRGHSCVPNTCSPTVKAPVEWPIPELVENKRRSIAMLPPGALEPRRGPRAPRTFEAGLHEFEKAPNAIRSRGQRVALLEQGGADEYARLRARLPSGTRPRTPLPGNGGPYGTSLA